MKKLFMAYAIIRDEAGREWRVNIGRDDDINECYRMRDVFVSKYAGSDLKVVFSGAHDFYLITSGEWRAIPGDYKGIAEEGKFRRTVFEGSIPGNNGLGGTTLLIEGDHFEIVGESTEVA